MDPIREGVMRFADKGSSVFQMVTQIFGLLPDGRELIRTEEKETSLRVSFSDRSDEGWPPFSLSIPRESHFSHANMSLLKRIGHWTVRDQPQVVLDHLGLHNEGFPEPDPGAQRGQEFSLEDGVELIVAGSERANMTLLFVIQERDPDSVPEGIRNRIKRAQEHWGRPGSD